MESKIESLEESAKVADQSSAGFMNPEIPTQKGKPGRKPDTPEQKAEKARLKAEQQKKNASGPQVQGPTTSINQGPAQPQQTQGPSSAQIARNFMPMISSATAQWVGDPRAQMTPAEIDACAEGLGMMIDKYMPTVMNKYAAEAVFLMAFGGYGLRAFSMKRQIELERYRQSQQFNQPPTQPIKEGDYAPTKTTEIEQ